MITVKIQLADEFLAPAYQTAGAAGADLRAAADGVIPPKERSLVGTGLYVEIPQGYEGQVRPRSGLALKHGIGMLNAPGTIDSDYRGEVGVLLYNSSEMPFIYKKGDRIAQLVFAKTERVEFELAKTLKETERGGGGFGSTGEG